ncbi:MAG: hypothetical protein RXO32_11265 [Thermoproteus sp.]|jgi:hypothetical protein
MAQTTQTQITIKKYGKGMNSKEFERRYMYLYIQPFNGDLEKGINEAVGILNELISAWEPPTSQMRFFRPDMWWEHDACAYCRRRAEYEIEKWKANEYVWRRGMCMRHYLVYHLTTIVPNEPFDLISNRPISITANTDRIVFDTETINYKYNVVVDKEKADMTVEYKGKIYKFTYRNHMHSYPYISSYMNILFDVHGVMDVFRNFLTDYVLQRRLYNNLVINDSITLPPSPPNYAACQSS